MDRMEVNNYARLCGVMAAAPAFSHSSRGPCMSTESKSAQDAIKRVATAGIKYLKSFIIIDF